MIYSKDLKKEFATKKEMFAAIKVEKENIIGLKKAVIKTTDPVLYHVKKLTADKATEDITPLAIGDTIYPVINTCNYFDSHGDVHIPGIWDLSIKDQKNKLYYIINHCLEIGKVISYPKDTLAFVQTVTWAELGLPFSGSTQALIFAAKLTEKTNKDFLVAALDKEDLQNSVRMRYITYMLCIDDDDPDFATEKDNFYKYLPDIANKEDVMNASIYWAVIQGAIEKEGSSVLFGSNDATPILYADPGSTSQKSNDPSEDSQEEEVEIQVEDCTGFNMESLLNIFNN